jgi:hypothetical protein
MTGALLALVVFPATSPSAAGQERFTRRSLPNPGSGRDYVCEVLLLPPGALPGSGGFGVLRVLFYAGPNCTGELVGGGDVFSQGATDENASASHVVSEAMLHTYFLMLQRAAIAGQRVIWLRCDDTKRNCIRGLGVRGTDSTLR